VNPRRKVIPLSKTTKNTPSWIESELAGCSFKDERLSKRFRTLLQQMGRSLGGSLPFACQDWANTKAAYRFLSNDRVTEADILAGHFRSTYERFAASEGPILVLHDTTEFSYQRRKPSDIGILNSIHCGHDDYGKARLRTTCGILMHSSLAVTTDGLPLGLSAIKFWTRKKFKGTNALRGKINMTRIPIEAKESIRWLENLKQSTEAFGDPGRCIHIGDRESDIYELFCLAKQMGTHFLVRSCVDRLANASCYTISGEMSVQPVIGQHRITVRNDKGEPSETVLDIKYRCIDVLPPIGKHKRYPPLTLTVVYAQERDTPLDRKKIDWKLITDLPIASLADAVEKLEWYAKRWKIETFHKIMKSGCRAEDSKLRTAQRLTNLIALQCILGWRVF
jgi:hypothetical protein